MCKECVWQDIFKKFLETPQYVTLNPHPSPISYIYEPTLSPEASARQNRSSLLPVYILSSMCVCVCVCM